MYVNISGYLRVPCANLDEAARKVRSHIDATGLGSTDWLNDGRLFSGHVLDAKGKPIARVSYNGRIWTGDGGPSATEIPGPYTPTPTEV